MLDQEQSQTIGAETDTETFDLVVVGAGIAGLNALFASTGYLPKGARVLLIDQKSAAGGMWNTAYDYVRLHQPHPMFTVGDLKWDWRKPADYLAARDEVHEHLAKSLTPIASQVSLTTEFGCTVSDCREVETKDGYRARVTYHPNDAAEDTRTVLADRAVFASGLDYRMAAPLPLSCDAVLSIAPGDLSQTLAAHPYARVYVVGGARPAWTPSLPPCRRTPHERSR